MAKMDTVLTGAGSFANELVGLVRDLRIGLRAQMERTFPGVPFTPGPAFHWPRVKDDESFVAGVAEAGEAANCIGPAAQKIFGIIDRVEGDIARFKDETARRGIAKLGESGESWDCEDITAYRREAQTYMQQVFAYAATLHFAMQRTLWNIEFIHECPPHPCDDPAASAYPWYARRGYAENGGGDYDAGGELKVAVDARAAAERAARDAEAEWKVQSERAAEAEAQGRQEREARWAAERALRETEARAKQAEQGRSAAERMAEEAAKDREAAQARATELEERTRQLERDQTAESYGGAETQPTARTSAAKGRPAGRKRRGGRAES
jgi:hypothetical protein